MPPKERVLIQTVRLRHRINGDRDFQTQLLCHLPWDPSLKVGGLVELDKKLGDTRVFHLIEMVGTAQTDPFPPHVKGIYLGDNVPMQEPLRAYPPPEVEKVSRAHA